MFAKFTQKAIDVVQSAQNYALKFCHDEVLSQHLLLGLVFQTKGVQAKILNFDKINFGELIIEVQNSTSINPERLNGLNCKETQNINERQNQKSCKNCENQNCSNIQFSKSSKEILELALKLSNELNSKFVMPQHIALAILESKNSGAYKIFKKFNIDEEKIIPNLKKMLDKSSDIVNPHPENAVENTQLLNINDFFREKTISQILENAKSKLTTSGYEILGSEQLLQSILENKDYKITNILEQYNLTSEALTEKLKEFTTRSAEFENSEKQIIFTPNAFCALLLALDYAKESGSVGIEAEHVILGILKSKKGIAYKILSSMIGDFTTFEDIVLKSTNDKMPETLAILRLAKGYALELNSQTVGTEIILLGILSYGAGIAFNVLKRLGITLKDAQNEVEKLLKAEKIKQEVISPSYSARAKKILEVAYETAKEHKRNKIKSENILYGITKMPNCLAMQVLTNLGTDVLELQQGIKQELLGGMEL